MWHNPPAVPKNWERAGEGCEVEGSQIPSRTLLKLSQVFCNTDLDSLLVARERAETRGDTGGREVPTIGPDCFLSIAQQCYPCPFFRSHSSQPPVPRLTEHPKVSARGIYLPLLSTETSFNLHTEEKNAINSQKQNRAIAPTHRFCGEKITATKPC